MIIKGYLTEPRRCKGSWNSRILCDRKMKCGEIDWICPTNEDNSGSEKPLFAFQGTEILF
jgi:hypothetical protein